MKFYSLLASFFMANIALCQVPDSYTDPRDGQKYKIIPAGGKIWFRENLRYKTNTSFYPNFSKDSLGWTRGNYYLNHEAGSVCPPGWKLPTIEDWQAYIADVIEAGRLNKDSIKINRLPPPNSSMVVTLSNFHLMKDTLLHFSPIGWVEGNKIANTTSISIWVSDSLTNDNKYHIHMAQYGYVVHTHTHHVIDKPRKIRKFAVRCVCEASQFNQSRVNK